MTENIVRFSRLLRIFQHNSKPAYIIELEENNKKELYISLKTRERRFIKQNNVHKLHKEYFNNLSNQCLMSQCTDATSMFEKSPITHFEADCSSLICGNSMFCSSNIRFIKTKFPLLESGCYMFENTKINKMSVDFPKLKISQCMFDNTILKKITSQFPSLERAKEMFEKTPLKIINCQFLNIQHKDDMFKNTPAKLKEDFPHYFI